VRTDKKTDENNTVRRYRADSKMQKKGNASCWLIHR